jgi:adenylate kinase
MTNHRFATEEIEKFSTVDLITELKRRYQVLSRPERSCVLLGHPYSGITSQSAFLRKEWGLCSIKREDIFKKPEADIQDALIKLSAEISSFRCRRGFVLENFPETEREAKLFDAMLSKKQDGAKSYTPIMLSTPSDNDEARASSLQIVKERASGHMVHESSGRVYNNSVSELSPQIANVDDITGEPLVCPRRDPSQISDTVRAWWNERKPQLESYFGSRLHVLDASQSRDQVSTELSKILLTATSDPRAVVSARESSRTGDIN